MSNSVDPEQTPHLAVPAPCLNHFLRPACPNIWSKYGIANVLFSIMMM